MKGIDKNTLIGILKALAAVIASAIAVLSGHGMDPAGLAIHAVTLQALLSALGLKASLGTEAASSTQVADPVPATPLFPSVGGK